MAQPMRIRTETQPATGGQAAGRVGRNGQPPIGLLAAGALCTLLALGGLVALLGLGGGERAEAADVATATPAAQPAVEPTATASCKAAAEWLDAISYLIGKGAYREAADQAAIALGHPELCPADRPALQSLAIEAGLESIFATPFDPRDVAAQQALIERYQGLRTQADDWDVRLPSSARVAGRAREIGQFLLARRAYEAAFTEGELGRQDRAQLSAYVSTLHDLGWWWASGTQGASQEEGLRLLVTCYRLDLQERIGSGACYGALTELLGQDPEGWPEPVPSPLLGTD